MVLISGAIFAQKNENKLKKIFLTVILCVVWTVLCTEMHSLDQDGQELGDPSASTTRVLGIKGLYHRCLAETRVISLILHKNKLQVDRGLSVTQAVKVRELKHR